MTWWRVSAASTPRWRRAASTSSASGREPGNCYTRHLERDDLAERLSSGWGSVLKPSACYGLLCFGPSRGRNVTFVSPRDWITGAWQQPGGDTAMRTVLRRFLDGYGPTTADDFSVGVWSHEVKKGRVTITVVPFSPMKPPARQALSAAANVYERLLDAPVTVAWA